MTAIFDSLSLQFTPNTVPTWSGTIPMNQYPTGARIINAELPLSQVSANEYEWVSFDLWVEESTVTNETSMSLKGVPYSVRPLAKLAIPTIVAGSVAVFEDTLEEGDSVADYNVIESTTFGEVLILLFENTGWTVKIGASYLLDKPVVTEAEPVVALNGSLLEQLAEILTMFSPNDLWGQTLAYYVNIFDATISIVTPEGLNPTTVSIGDVRPTELNCREVYVDLPATINIQESEAAMFIDPSHIEDYLPITETYENETSTVITELDSDQTEISASVKGERFRVGGLVLSEEDDVEITQSTWAGITLGPIGVGVPEDIDQDIYREFFARYITGRTSTSHTAVDYEYLVGPPYENDAEYYTTGAIPQNALYPSSHGGTRQQISRDYGSTRINKDNYPPYLLTVDGIRVLRKKSTTVESSASDTFFTVDSVDYAFPASEIDADGVTTYLDEVFSYDEEGNLIGDRVRKIVVESGGYTVTETFRSVSPMTEELSSEMVYTISSQYAGGVDGEDGDLVSTSVTDVSAQVIPADQSGPSATSVLSSADGADVLREKTLITNTIQYNTKYSSSGVSTVSETPTGSVYVSIPTLTLEEIEEYLNMYYNITPSLMYYASFQSEHIDVRGILGGSLQLVEAGSTLHRAEFYEIGTSPLVQYNQEVTSLLSAMETSSFRVTGVAMDWNKQEPPSLSIAMCQLI